ncbi:MAG: UDP-N-acetylmuramoyl-L-alanine--D-glutamate ligase [Actinomycetota bacterium]
MSGRFEGERAVVVGAGVAGASAARVLRAEGASVTITEARPISDVALAPGLRADGIELLAGGHDPAHLDGSTLVVTAPGVPEAAPVLAWARARGLPVWGEMELGARIARAPVVAVTGTNGKTTTTGMITACLVAAGLDAVACGNIGHPFPVAAREGHDVLVVECSSFQLRMQESLHPRVSVLLNLAPDHLDWHGSYAAYADAKSRVFARQVEGDVHVGNRDDAEAGARSSRAPCDVVWFRGGAPREGEVGYDRGVLRSRLPGNPADLGSVGGSAGLRCDAAAAAAASLSFGVPPEAVRHGLAAFEPSPHRGQTVAVVDGVRFIDDSKATNVHAALAAIDGVNDAVLIAGGRAKGVDLAPLASRAARLRAVVAIGEAAPDLVRVFEGLRPVERAPSIEDAARRAFELAGPSGCVLLAPACASWDQFSSYVERGERFRAAAIAMLREVGARGGA